MSSSQANPSDMAANQGIFIILRAHFSPFTLLFNPLTLSLICIRLVLGLEVESWVDRTEEHLTVDTLLAFADHQMDYRVSHVIVAATYLILIQSLKLLDAISVSISSRPLYLGGRSFRLGGRYSSNPTGT